jgi:hypothetical protein
MPLLAFWMAFGSLGATASIASLIAIAIVNVEEL